MLFSEVYHFPTKVCHTLLTLGRWQGGEAAVRSTVEENARSVLQRAGSKAAAEESNDISRDSLGDGEGDGGKDRC